MPTKHAAIKDLRKNIKRHARNVRLATHVKQALRKSKDLLTKGDIANAKKEVAKFQQIIDKAAKNMAISKNAARRKKSRIMKAIFRAGKK
jgi:small subunit ribosomal protein S20